MDIIGILKAFIATVLLVITGPQVPVSPQAIQQAASTTDSIVNQLSTSTTTPTKEDLKQAYDLGKAVGKLEAKAEQPAPIPPQPQPIMTGNTAPTAESPAPGPEVNIPPAEAPNLARIDIVSPIPGKGLGREYFANDYQLTPSGGIADGSEPPNDSNSIDLGVVIYDKNAEVTTANDVKVKITNQSGDTTLPVYGGDLIKIYPQGQMRQVRGYTIHYEFRVTGTYIFKFMSGDMYKEVTLDVKETPKKQ